MENEIDWNAAVCEAIQGESIDPELSILNKLSPELILQILSRLRWNEALLTAPVCSLFRDLLQSATLWATLKELNFTDCNIPLAKHILKLTSMCPSTEKMKISEVIIEHDDIEVAMCDMEENKSTEELLVQDVEDDQEADGDEMDEDLGDAELKEEMIPPMTNVYDKFLAKVLKLCKQLRDLTLQSHNISGETIEVICQGVPRLESLLLSSAKMLRSKHVERLLSCAEELKCLHIERCELHYPLIKQESGQQLGLTSLSLIRCGLRELDIAVIGQNCPRLRHLNLSESSVFNRFGLPEVASSNFQCLETVSLRHCQDLGQVNLEDMMELQSIETNQSAYLSHVKLKCPKLARFQVDGCSNLVELAVHSDQLKCLELAPMFPVLSDLDVKCEKLTKLLLYNCPLLRRDQIVGIDNLSGIKHVTMRCVQVSFDDVNHEILPKLETVEEMSLEGFGSSTLEITSKTLKKLECQELAKVSGLSLDTPELATLRMTNVRALSEEDFARNIPQSLSELRLCQISGLHGSILSEQGHVLVNLSTLVIEDCRFMKTLTLADWPSLNSVRVGDCPQLRQVYVKGNNIMKLQFYWLHLRDFGVEAPQVEQLELKGSDFLKFWLISESLNHLEVFGLCLDSNVSTQAVYIRGPSLKRLSIQKSPYLTANIMNMIMLGCPSVSDLHVMGCQELREISISSRIKTLKLAGLPHLTDIMVDSKCKLESISLSGLPKLNLDIRRNILQDMASHLEKVELRLMNEETAFHIMYPNVVYLSVDQGIHLHTLEIQCPKLKSLRIKGCPNLTKLLLTVGSVSDLDISKSMPLNALESLHVASSTVRNLASILSHYCPIMQHMSLHVKSLSLADLVRFGLRHRNLKSLLVYSETQMDDQLKAQFPSPFQIPYQILERRNGKDIAVSFT